MSAVMIVSDIGISLTIGIIGRRRRDIDRKLTEIHVLYCTVYDSNFERDGRSICADMYIYHELTTGGVSKWRAMTL